MGSVMNYIECPNCKLEAFNDFYYKTGEEYTSCGNCGYHYSAFYKRNSKGKLITKDKTNNYSFDNLIMKVIELKKPYGSYRIQTYNSIATQWGTLSNKKQYNHLVDSILKNDTIEFCTVSRLLRNNIVTNVLIDKTKQ